MQCVIRLIAIVCCGLVALLAGPASAEKRVAPVIGNARYEHISILPNVINDTKAMAALFEAAKFDSVVVAHDLRAAELKRALRELADRAAGADVAALLYAGHGIEVDRVNYLIPGRCAPQERPRRGGRDGLARPGAAALAWPR